MLTAERVSRWRQGLLLLLIVGTAMTAKAGLEPLPYQQQNFEHEGERFQIRLPQGYRLELLSDQLRGPRLLTFTENGDLFIGSKSGNVYRLPPPYRNPQVLIKLGDYPHSVAFRKNEILIAQTHGLYRAPYRPGQRKLARGDVRLLAELPGGRGHNSRSVAVGPDGRVYLSLGITGNCSNEYLDEAYDFDDRRGGVLVLGERSGQGRWQTFASGLRNPVGFAWRPLNRVMYASNNGPDHLGFEQPPEYFSRIDAGSFHGMPWFQFDGRRVMRDNCIGGKPPRSIDEVVAPEATFPARNAPMGVAFVPEGGLEKSLENDAIVALRGSWGTRPSGGFFGDDATRRQPKLVVVRFDKDGARRVDDLLTGFQLADGERWARPVGVAMGPDGALYFTSDSGINGLFRLSRKP